MRNTFVLILLVALTANLDAQVGVTGGYFFQQIPEWEQAVLGNRSNEDLLADGYAAEVDYQLFPFENLRIELYPALNYSRSNSENINQLNFNQNFNLQQFGFDIKTNVYPLSLKADCDCPTFSRQAGLLEKGFFIQIAPGISYFQAEMMQESDTGLFELEGDNFSFKLGLGMGLDIGLSDFLTITPVVKYNRYFNAQWEGLQAGIAQLNLSNELTGSDTSPINQLYAGLRFGFRFR